MTAPANRPRVDELLAQANNGDVAARERLFELYRPYLRLIARRQVPRQIQKRLDESDIVQETCIDAMRGMENFQGRSEPEFTAWLAKILERALQQALRDNQLKKRDVRLEAPQRAVADSTAITWYSVAGGETSPSNVVLRGERALYLAEALEGLPDDQRAAIEMRYLDQLPLQTIADELGRSIGSVTGMIRRGVAVLHDVLSDTLEENS